MKKKIVLLLVGALTIGSLAACGNNADTGENVESVESVESAESAAPEETSGTSESGAASGELNLEDELMEPVYPGEITVEDYVTLGDYKNMEVSLAPASVSEEEIDDYITDKLANATDPAAGITDRAVEDGDTVNIDYVGKMDGEPFDRGSANGDTLKLGSGQFIEGFESGLLEKKVKPSETVDLELTFPDPYTVNPDMAGKEVVFTVTVNFIVAGLDDFNDERAAALNPDCATVEDYRAYAEEMLMEEAQEQYQMELENAILTKLAEEAEFKQDIPEGLGAEYYNQNYQWIYMGAYYYGMDVDTYARMSGYEGADALKEDLRNSAIAFGQQMACMQAVANAEGMTVTDEELEAGLESLASENGYESVDAMKEAGLDVESQRTYMMYTEVMDYLLEVVTVNDAEDTE